MSPLSIRKDFNFEDKKDLIVKQESTTASKGLSSEEFDFCIWIIGLNEASGMDLCVLCVRERERRVVGAPVQPSCQPGLHRWMWRA